MEQQQQQDQVVAGGENATTLLSAKLQKPNTRYISIEDRDMSVIIVGALSEMKCTRTASTIRIVLRPYDEDHSLEAAINTDTEREAEDALILITNAIKEYMIGARDILEIASKVVNERRSKLEAKASEEKAKESNPQ